jgi:dTDP-4-amino-4,6-dideoxygalactose transaminase
MIGEEEKNVLMEVLESPMLVHGPRAKSFEQSFADYTAAPHAVTVSSCTAGMHLVWFALGIGPGDEIIVPAQTHVATAHAVEFLGATPVFCDAEPATGNIDIDLLENLITERTRAICIVHYLGMPVDMVRVNAIAKKHDLFVMEDCALALGTTLDGKHAGLLGDAGAFSFYPVKHMTTAEGGMVITRHKELAEKITRMKAFGVDKVVGERKVPGVYDVTMLGFNYRMNELQAAIGVEQLKKVPAMFERRKANYEKLWAGLSEIDGISLFRSTGGKFQSSYYCMSAVLDDQLMKKRPRLIEKLNAAGVGTSIYYPAPVPYLTYYSDKYGYTRSEFPVAARISYGSIALPVGPHLVEEDMQYVVDVFKKTILEEK